MEELTDRQFTQVREALHSYYRDFDGRSATWRFVFEEVLAAAEESGITLDIAPSNGADRLRQFVEGKLDKDGTRRFPVPQPSFLAAVRAFVTTSDLLPTDQEI